MSYILDALKKSEQERKKGTVPGLGTVQGLPAHRFGNDWPRRYYLPGALLLLTILALLAWLYLREPLPSQTNITTPTPLPLPATPATGPAPTGALPEKTLSPSRSKELHNDVQPATPPVAAAPRSPKPLPTSGATPKTATSQVLSSPPIVPPPAKPELQGTIAVSQAILPAAMDKTPPIPSIPDAAAPENAPPPSDAPSEEAEVVVKPEDMPVVPLAELPPEIKGVMPEVKIGIHFFSDDPASRRAGINGRLLHEGQQVEKDLTLKEITRDGAILSFQGRRFSLPVFPR